MTVQCVCVCVCICVCIMYTQALCRPLLSATITPNLENVENNICLVDASKQMFLFLKNMPKKIAPMPPASRIGITCNICTHTDIYIKGRRLGLSMDCHGGKCDYIYMLL